MQRHHVVAAGVAAAVVLFATGEGCGGGEVTPCAALDASNFDQSCTTSSDCVVETEPGSCCPGVAISGTAQAQFMAAASKALADGCTPARGCTVSCPAAPPCCFGGKCQIGDRCPGPVTCTLGATCTNADICTGGIAGCTSNCQCLNGTWQAPCPQDAPQSGSACAPDGTECGYVTQASACGGSVDCNCKSGAWTCGPTCVIPNDDAAACDDANVLASNYDQSCTVDSDCVAIVEGNACEPCVFDGMLNAAINASAMAKYNSDIAGTPGASGIEGAGCSATGGGTVSGNSNWGPFCCSGTCHVGSQCSNSTPTDAGADASDGAPPDAGAE